jgi:hypothetical protein
MLDEFALRRQDFLPGHPIRLADGQCWTFPATPMHGASGTVAPGEAAGFGPDYAALVAGVRKAEDEVERLRAELVLALCLLWRNYDLSSADLFDLFGYPPGDLSLAEVQREFHRVALEHVRQSWPPANPVARREVPGRAVPAAAKSEPRKRQGHRPEPALVGPSI